jgi:uncharacterized damage-inducible protein DinB
MPVEVPMPMQYEHTEIPDSAVPAAAFPFARHMLETYVSETNKVVSVWRGFADADLDYRPHAASSAVGEILKHQLLSERRFFAEFLGLEEPAAATVVPAPFTITNAIARLAGLARARLPLLAQRPEPWWLEEVPFFDVTRQRVWIFWRRLLHTGHHRTQLSVCLRLLGRPVPPTYGPTADVTWTGADPTQSVAAAERR